MLWQAVTNARVGSRVWTNPGKDRRLMTSESMPIDDRTEIDAISAASATYS